MKMIINVPDWIVNNIVLGDCDDVDFCELGETMYVVLPDNATNGDMIKAIFPKGKVRREVSCTHDKTVFSFPDGIYFGAECRFNTDWWNEPYKGEQKDGKA